MATKKRIDANLVSKQKHEIDYIAKKFKISPAQVTVAIAMAGRSRRKVYAYIRNNFVP